MQTNRQYVSDLTTLHSQDHPDITDINIFTDGSKTEEHTGAGFVIYKNKTERHSNSIRLPMEITVFQADSDSDSEKSRSDKSRKTHRLGKNRSDKSRRKHRWRKDIRN